MKKKIALLLAVIMTLTALPMTAFADSSNGLTKVPTVVPKGTLFFEEGVSGLTLNNVAKKTAHKDNVIEAIDYYTDGMYLYMSLSGSSPVYVGGVFDVTLENAKWFFRDTNAGVVLGGNAFTQYNAMVASIPAFNLAKGQNIATLPNAPETLTKVIDSAADGDDWYKAPIDSTGQVAAGGALTRTYDYNKGTLLNYYNVNYPESGVSTSYLRYYQAGSADVNATAGFAAGFRSEIPYRLDVLTSGADTVARVTILPETNTRVTYINNDTAGKLYEVRIPLVCFTTASNDVRVKINQNLSGISSTGAGYLMGVASDRSTSVVVDAVKAKFDFVLGNIKFKEERIGSIVTSNNYTDDKPDFILDAPDGFSFIDPAKLNPGFVLTVDGLLGYDANADGIDDFAGLGGPIPQRSPHTKASNNVGYYYEFATDVLGNVDYSRLEFFVKGLLPSTRGTGFVTMKNLRVYADDDLEYKMYPIEFSGEAISKVSKDVLDRTNWTITFKTLTDLPELFTGRYDPASVIDGVAPSTYNNQYKAMAAAGDDHKTARVQILENSIAAWWAERETFLTLSDGVLFRKVEIVTADKIYDVAPYQYKTSLRSKHTFGTSAISYTSTEDGRYVNDGIRHGYVKIDGNQMSISSIKIESNQKAKLEMDIWVSINVNFEGPVMLTLSGSAVPTQGSTYSTYEEVPPIAIANTIQPVVINTTVTDVKIGYQYQPVADIEIVETKAGALKIGKDLRLSLTDLVSSDNIIFNPASTLAVVEGNLKIGNISLSNNGGASQTTLGVLGGNQLLSTGADYITAIISKTSTVKSTLKLSNVSVKVDRNAPETNYKNYKAIAWGTAIAENYGPNRDEFGTIEDAGKAADYLKIITSATDKTSILTQEVRVTEGEAFYSVNGVVKEMDAKAYISVASNSMMVPLRFVSYAFGLRDDQIHWDNNAKVATVFAPTKTLQFAKDSDKMVVNGVVTSMVTQPVDGSAPRAIKAELVTDENNIARLYIPFRPLGQAFGVQVAWDGETRAAIYNPSANDNPNAADTNTFSSGTAE